MAEEFIHQILFLWEKGEFRISSQNFEIVEVGAPMMIESRQPYYNNQQLL